jgi:SAM-dependent methyltransferase
MKQAHLHADFYHANIEELSAYVPRDLYDLVYSFGVLHHTPNPERALCEAAKYMHEKSELRIMLYHWPSTKALALAWKHRGRANVAQGSEAQPGCPVTYTYTVREAEALLNRCGFEMTSHFVTHIFPYEIDAYKCFKYVVRWYYRWMPNWLFQMLEHHLGWHLCIVARRK